MTSTWTKVRVTAYVTVALSILASLLATMGYGTYDSATMMYDPPAVNIAVIASVIGGMLTSIMAAVAAIFKWGSK